MNHENTEHEVKAIDTPKDDQEFGVQLVTVTSDKDKFDWSMRLNNTVEASLPSGEIKSIQRYNNQLAYIN